MQNFIDFIIVHQVLFGALFIAILDFVFAISPKLESNGILHSVYVFFKKDKK